MLLPVSRAWRRHVSGSLVLQQVTIPPNPFRRYGTSACLTWAVNRLGLVRFALDRTYLINGETTLAEIAEFGRAP
jgi:hypothetical protein